MKKLSIIIFLLAVLSSCSKWNEYITDYEFTAVYFAQQKQLRTVIEDDGWGFEFGVTLSGQREYKTSEWAKYEIDETLLSEIEGADQFTLLPASMYTLSDNRTFRSKDNNRMLLISRLTLNETFMADPLALQGKYALPVRITETSVDTILQGRFRNDAWEVLPMDYAIIAVKYYNPYHGSYYARGVQKKLVDEQWADDQTYFEKDLSKNKAIAITTTSMTELTSTYAGTNVSGSGVRTKIGFKLTVNPDNTVEITMSPEVASNQNVGFTEISGTGTYDPVSKEFALSYEYTFGTGVNAARYKVDETLIFRNLDRPFETW